MAAWATLDMSENTAEELSDRWENNDYDINVSDAIGLANSFFDSPVADFVYIISGITTLDITSRVAPALPFVGLLEGTELAFIFEGERLDSGSSTLLYLGDSIYSFGSHVDGRYTWAGRLNADIPVGSDFILSLSYNGAFIDMQYIDITLNGEKLSGDKKCVYCDHEVTQPITALTHTWVTNGNGTHNCTTANGCATINEPCNENGTNATCDKCGYKIPAPLCPHTNKTTAYDPTPTCTTGGANVTTCDDCSGTVSTQLVPATGHTWGTWAVTTPATATTTGIETRTCTVCNIPETRTIPATGRGNSGGGSGGGGGGFFPSTSTAPSTIPATNSAAKITTGTNTWEVSNIPQTALTDLSLSNDIPVTQVSVPTGATGNISINVGTEFAGKNAILVRYNSVSGKLEFVSAVTVDANGNVNKNVTQAGDYLVLTFKTGDVTGTGTVDSGDALAVLRHAVGLAPFNCIQIFVANGRIGDVDSSDALNILRYAVGLIERI